jgi:hypothetical protein
MLWAHRVSGARYRHAVRALEPLPAGALEFVAERFETQAGSERTFHSDGSRVTDSWNNADAQLHATASRFVKARLPVAFDDDEIEGKAELYARGADQVELEAIPAYIESRGLEVPIGKFVTPESIKARAQSVPWWRRKLRTMFARGAEHAMREAGMVSSHRSAYVSADGLKRRAQEREKSKRWIKSQDLLCVGTGELFPLEDVAAKGMANQSIRRGELMIRARGFQEIAGERGDVGIFLTLTCPSAFHATLRSTGKANPNYNGSSPRDAQAWLNKQWQKARAKLSRLSITYYGFRVAEPHHDGTPHWHAILFVAGADADRFGLVVREVWLSEYADEPGAREARVVIRKEDAARGNAVGYIAKYIAKNIDGAGSIGAQASDEGSGTVGRDALAVQDWARIWGIRQFQQLGGACVGVWRELRRLMEPTDCPELEEIRLTTTKTDEAGPSWSRFHDKLGGIEGANARSRALLWKDEPRKTDAQGRRKLAMTRYGEWRGRVAVGVRIMSVCERLRHIATRINEWRRVHKVRLRDLLPLGPVEITVRDGSPAALTGAPPLLRDVAGGPELLGAYG